MIFAGFGRHSANHKLKSHFARIMGALLPLPRIGKRRLYLYLEIVE